MHESAKNKNRIFLLAILLIAVVIGATIVRDSIEKKKRLAEKNAQSSQSNNSDSIRYITDKNLQKEILERRENLSIIDIRDAESYSKEYIANTTNIPLEDLYEKYEMIENRDHMTVIIDYDNSRTEELSQLCEFLESNGFENLYVLSGGILAWKKSFKTTISLGDPNSFIDHSKVMYVKSVELKNAVSVNYPMVILDVRSPRDYKMGHIPGAINIPSNEIEKRSGEIKKAKEVIVYSETELKDFQIAVKLYDLGFIATYVLEGGFSNWKNNGFELEK